MKEINKADGKEMHLRLNSVNQVFTEIKMYIVVFWVIKH
jgi:hypothetical protein